MLRTVYQEHPEEISAVIERLMYEDLNSQTLGPGLQPQGLNARSLVEFRSKIGTESEKKKRLRAKAKAKAASSQNQQDA